MTQTHDPLPLATIRRIDEICDEFERGCRQGDPQELPALLRGWEGPQRATLLGELIAIEQDNATRLGGGLSRADYLRLLPEDEETIRAAFDLEAHTPADSAALGVREAEIRTPRGDGPAADQARVSTPADDGQLRSARQLTIRCPHCHDSLEVAADSPFTDITCPACGTTFSLVAEGTATAQAAPLKSIGHFELLSRLGVGAFGTVWKAHDSELDRTVAIKIPRSGALDPVEDEQFLREARAAAQLRHPNIIPVHEVGRDGDTLYIVSDYVDGISLSEWLSGQQPTVREAAELCRKIALALDYAHEMGVIHRDLKPSNIIIDGDGQPHIMDFGLARREMGELTLTADGQLLGTPAYMSPEQARGESHTVDRRTDVYSLGVLLFEMLTGERPFRGSAPMLMHQVIHEPPPSPRRFNANTPKDLETITLKCLEKEPARRYPTAHELADELRRYLSHEPIHARPVSRLERAWRWCRRYPGWAGAVAATAALLLVLGIGSPIAAFRIARERQQTEAAREGEATLRGEITTRDKVHSAQLLCRNREFKEAENLISGISASELRAQGTEAADVFRALGRWHLIEYRWQESARYFNALMFGPGAADPLEPVSAWKPLDLQDLLWSAPLQLEVGNPAGYERLRDWYVAVYEENIESSSMNPIIPLTIGLLTPADAQQMDVLAHAADVAAGADWYWPPDAARSSYALGLYQYRRGHYDQSLDWLQKCLSHPDQKGPLHPRARLVAAMVYFDLDQRDRAKAELARARPIIEEKFNPQIKLDHNVNKIIHQWLYNRVLLREATELIEGPTPGS